MSENKFIEKMLKHQEELDSKFDEPSARELAIEADKAILQKVLETVDSPEEVKMIQEAFDEYIRVGDEIYKEKGEEMREVEDIKEKIPNNYWLKLVHENNEVPEIDFDVVWKNVKENVDFDEIQKDIAQDEAKEAKNKGQIN